MSAKRTKKASSKALNAKQRKEIESLAAMPDSAIGVRSIPEVKDWSGAKRGVFYRPVKRQLTLRLDADVIAWFREGTPGGRGYQTKINRALREHIAQQDRPRRRG